jgi:uncharacterized protein
VTTYVDASALLKRYVAEPDSRLAETHLLSDPVLVTSWVTMVEVQRNLARHFSGADLTASRSQLNADLDAFAMVSCDEATSRAAGAIGETLGVRSLDAIHLASAQRLHISDLGFITFDLRQGQAARSLGFRVLGC